MDGEVLDRREVGKFQAGRYLSWQLRGRIRVEFQKIRGTNAVISGIFFDTPDGSAAPPAQPRSSP